MMYIKDVQSQYSELSKKHKEKLISMEEFIIGIEKLGKQVEDKLFEGAIFPNGKQFPFIRVTIANKAKIQRKIFSLSTIDFIVGNLYLQKIKKEIAYSKSIGMTDKDITIQSNIESSFLMQRIDTSLVGSWKQRRNQTEALRLWKRVRATAFQKNFLWKWFHIVPKEFRHSRMLFNIAGGLQVDFFGYFKAIVSEYEKQLKSLEVSLTANSSKKGTV